MRLIVAFVALLAGLPAMALDDRVAYTALARQGWTYELRTTMVGRDLSIPVHIHGRDLAGASLCLVGERPHAQSLRVINAFRALMSSVFEKPLPMRYAGRSADLCGSGRTVVVRLYSGHPPNLGLTGDLYWLNATYELGLPLGREYAATSPAMAQTFFGRRGQGTHIMVKQPSTQHPGQLERAFYGSILVEELFQAFTFGMDILQFDPNAAFLSKLQERPVNVHRLPWSSRAFMRALLSSNPRGLCLFDVFMLHAVARSPVDETVDPAFIAYIDSDFERLIALAQATLENPDFAPILDSTCTAVPLRP